MTQQPKPDSISLCAVCNCMTHGDKICGKCGADKPDSTSRGELPNVRMTYYKYKCPNGVHQFVLLDDTETCIHCYIEDKIDTALQAKADKLLACLSAKQNTYAPTEYGKGKDDGFNECRELCRQAFKQQLKAVLSEQIKAAQDTTNVNRLEVIDDTGRAYVKGLIYGSPVSVRLSFQDDCQTLKVFVKQLLPTNEEESGT